MLIKEILIHTPWWVWLLLAYLLYTGITLLFPSQTTPRKMLIMPCIFFVWSIHSIFNKFLMPWVALTIFTTAMALGFLFSKITVFVKLPTRLDTVSGVIHRSGSIIPLIVIIINFGCIYALNVYAAYHSDSFYDLNFIVIFNIISGLSSGMFWGVFVCEIKSVYLSKGSKSRLKNKISD